MLNGIFTINIDTNSSIKFVESSDLIIDRISSIMNKKPTLYQFKSIYDFPYLEIRDELKINSVKKHFQAYMQSAYFLFKGGQPN